jgi:hypothetical protein
VGAGHLTEPISVRARFERFPATVKGAFILRGEDANPHQVVFREANVVGIGLGSERPMPMAPATLDVAPHRDVFVPFEVPVSDLDPGWYTMTCDVEVDGIPRTYDGGRRFAMAWPRSTTRRGHVPVGRRVDLGDGTTVLVDQVDCGGDSIKLHVRVEPPGPLTAKLSADGARLEILEIDVEETSGRGRITAYPLMRGTAVLRLELRGRRRGAEGALEVKLP